MAILRYNGPHDVRELWGFSFPRGASVETNDPDLIAKAIRLDGFERLDVEPVLDPDPEDYPASPEPAAFDELKIPVVGAGLLPDGWEKLHWKQRVKLAKELTGKDCANGSEADAALREALEPQ
jgi:hypothetical protein